ncbi:MAG: hypothetical protein JWM76_1834 [Pseudonocardiales bacterium]|nr:hypothetical protein [Pseudonocardiales bacterium]
MNAPTSTATPEPLPLTEDDGRTRGLQSIGSNVNRDSRMDPGFSQGALRLMVAAGGAAATAL